MAGMTDRTLVAHLMDNMLHTSTASTYTAGTGGTTISWTVPLHLRLYTTTGSETASGTENTAGNSPGYTALGQSMGTTGGAFLANGGTTAGQSYNNAQVQWTASGTWSGSPSGVAGIEVWDTSGTPIRILWGPLTTAIITNAVTSGDTVTFAASGSIIADASAW
jgi:hypothetical protein